jgi:hypothetical protein
MELTLPRTRTADLSASFTHLIEADLTRPMAFALLSLVFIVVRLPYVNFGFGTDPDAWRVALSAYHFWETGHYFPSRLPGNPLHEMVMILFIPGGWIATNIATALASLLGVYFFALIVRELKLPTPGLLVIGFAFTPLLYINSISTMDYMWTLTALLGAYYFVIKGNPLLAGVMLGAAMGFRMQSVMFWAPLVYLMWREGRLREVPPLTLAAGGIAAMSFAPVLVVYGRDFLNYYGAAVGYQDVVRLLGKEALGVIGGLGVLAGAAFSLSKLKELPRDAIRDAHVTVWLAAIVLYFVSFSNLPHEIAYLIPVFPFGFMLMARYFTRAALIGAVGAILLAGVLDITTPSEDFSSENLRSARIGRGLVLSNGVTMDTQHQRVDQIIGNELPDRSVVLTGFIFPQLAVRERDRLESRIIERDYGAISMLSDRGESVNHERDIRYVWLLTYETFDILRGEGYSFFLVPDAAGATAALYDYRPALFGATFLELQRAGAAAGAGTASTDR